MRRLFVVFAVVAALLAPTGAPANAATAGACTWSAQVLYPGGLPPLLWGSVAPAGGQTEIAMALTCLGVGTQSWELVGGGSGLSSCAAEAMSVTMVDRGGRGYAAANWVRVGAYGWLVMQLQGAPGGPSSRYGYEGPLAWNPGGGTACVDQPVFAADMIGLGPHFGL